MHDQFQDQHAQCCTRVLQFDILRRNISTLRHFISLPIPSQHFLKNSIIKINILGKWASYFILYFSYVDLFPICIYSTCLHIFWGVRVGGYWTAIVSLCLMHIAKLTFLLSHVFNMLFIDTFVDSMSLSVMICYCRGSCIYVWTAAFGYCSAYGDSCIWILFGIWGQLHLDIVKPVYYDILSCSFKIQIDK